MKKMSSMYLSLAKDFPVCVSRKPISISSIKIYAYGVSNFVPMALPEICCWTFVSNSKKLFLKKYYSAMSTESAGGTFLSDLSSNSALSPALCGMLGYKPTTSFVTKYASSGILPRLLIFSKKSSVSFLHIRFPWFHNRLEMMIQKFWYFLDRGATIWYKRTSWDIVKSFMNFR